MAALGYTAWAPDLRGYDESDCPRDTADYALPKFLYDVIWLIDVARDMDITGPVRIIAHDWGAVIGWRYVLSAPR